MTSDAAILQPCHVPTMFFVGVTTGQSSSRHMFPEWMSIIDRDEAVLRGIDLPIGTTAETYRRVVSHIKADRLARGALITTHKVGIFQAAQDLFDMVTDDARLCSEVSCIYKRDDRLIGHAVDPATSEQSLNQFIESHYWREHAADMLILGGGGSASAITAAVLTRFEPANRPQRLIIVDRNPQRLEQLRILLDRLPPHNTAVDLVLNDRAEENDRLLKTLKPGSLVINATGMGKDLPGSPLTDAAVFPDHGIVWELNYRGELEFLQQARAQSEQRRLTIADGWYYFVIGWATIVGRVFDVAITPDIYERLAHAAEIVR